MRRRGSYISRARRDILRDRLEAERQISLSTSSESNTGELPQFETTNSSVLSELRDILKVLEGGEERGSSDWSSMSEQDLERMLVGLTGSEKKFTLPWHIQRTVSAHSYFIIVASEARDPIRKNIQIPLCLIQKKFGF